MAHVKFGRHRLRLPGTPFSRTVLGIALVIGGILGFLPILGFWMIPLGLVVLSVDFAIVRRYRRRVEVWWFRKQQARAEAKKARKG